MPSNNPNIHTQGRNFPKGKSGNPNGRPPKTITEVLREIGDGTNIDGVLEITNADGTKKKIVIDAESKKTARGRVRTIKYLVGARLYQMALSGDLGAIKEINNRLDGAVKTQGEETPTNGTNPADLAAAFAAAMVQTTGQGALPAREDGVAAEPETA